MEENVKTTGAAAEAPAKKRRRGVSNETQAVNQLKFHEKDATNFGLFVGHLDEVRVDWSVNADGKTFTGLKVPRLTLHFASMHANVNERRHVYQTLFPVESSVDTMPGGKDEWRVNSVINWIKHMLDVLYLKGRPMTEAEENALVLDVDDFDEDTGEYKPVEPEDVIKAYAALFTNAAAMLNGTFGENASGKPCYKDANGNFIKLYMKLLRHKKRKNEWINVGQNGDLAFDSFIGAGVIEILKPNTPPAILRVDFARESITPKQIKKEPTPNPMMGGMGMANMGNVPMGNDPFSVPQTDAFNEAGGDMPF